jgi:hypothetical protein
MQPKDEASRFQVEIQTSNGANYDPRITKVMNDKPRENVQRGVSVPLGEFAEHLSPWGALRKANPTPSVLLSASLGPHPGSQQQLAPAPSGARSISAAKSCSDPGASSLDKL